MDSAAGLQQIPVLLRGEVEPIEAWMSNWETRRIALYVAVICISAGLYGFAMGLWRDPTQALYTGIKFPLIILLTTFGNALLNGMLAPLLGMNLRFSQSLQAILMSYTIASAILGAFAPLLLFIIVNVPPLIPGAKIPSHVYSAILLTQVAAISFAGIAANLRLLQILKHLGGSERVAWCTLLAWLSGNLFLGSQLVWIFRPFIGSPNLPIQFLRPNAFQGNFYEAVFNSIRQLFNL